MKKRITAAVLAAAFACFTVTPTFAYQWENISLGQAIADFLTDYISDFDDYYDYTSNLFQLEVLSVLTGTNGSDVLGNYLGPDASVYREQSQDGYVLDEGLLKAAAEDVFNVSEETIDSYRDLFPENYYIDEENTGYLVTGTDTGTAYSTEVELYDIWAYGEILYVSLHEIKYSSEDGQQLDEGYKIAVLQNKIPQTGNGDFCISLYYLYDMPDSAIETYIQMGPMNLDYGQDIPYLTSLDGLPVAGVDGMEAVPPTEGIRYPGMGLSDDEGETDAAEYETDIREDGMNSELNDRYYDLVRDNLARFNAMEEHSGCASLDTETVQDVEIARNYFEANGIPVAGMQLCRVNDCSKTEAVIAQRNMYFETDNLEMADDSVRRYTYDNAGTVYMLVGPVDYNEWDLDSIDVYACEDGYIFATADREIGGENVKYSIVFYQVEDFLRMYYISEYN